MASAEAGYSAGAAPAAAAGSPVQAPKVIQNNKQAGVFIPLQATKSSDVQDVANMYHAVDEDTTSPSNYRSRLIEHNKAKGVFLPLQTQKSSEFQTVDSMFHADEAERPKGSGFIPLAATKSSEKQTVDSMFHAADGDAGAAVGAERSLGNYRPKVTSYQGSKGVFIPLQAVKSSEIQDVASMFHVDEKTAPKRDGSGFIPIQSVKSSEMQSIEGMFHAADGDAGAPMSGQRSLGNYRPKLIDHNKKSGVFIPLQATKSSEVQSVESMFHVDEADRPKGSGFIPLQATKSSEQQNVDTMFHAADGDSGAPMSAQRSLGNYRPKLIQHNKKAGVFIPLGATKSSEVQNVETMFHADEADRPKRDFLPLQACKSSELQQIDTMFHAVQEEGPSSRPRIIYSAHNKAAGVFLPLTTQKSSEMQNVDSMFHAVAEGAAAPSK